MKKLSLLFILLAIGAGTALAQPKVIAHRGYWETPGSAQNSLTAFIKADSIGVFGSEIDVWLTADDRLIVNHDRVFKGTDIDMERSTQREICNIVLPNGENIPTLDAYLRLVASKPNTRLILEMKSLSDLNREDLAAEKIVKSLRKYGLVERTDRFTLSDGFDDEPHLAGLVDIELLLLDKTHQLMARKGGQRAADAPDRGVVLPPIHRLDVVGFDGAQADVLAFESHGLRLEAECGARFGCRCQSPMILLRMSIATPQALALSLIFDTRNFVSL